MQSGEAGKLKERSNQATVVAARTLSELGKVIHSMGESCTTCFRKTLKVAMPLGMIREKLIIEPSFPLSNLRTMYCITGNYSPQVFQRC